MVRIYTSLSLFVVSLLVANIVLGIFGGDYNELSAELREAQGKVSSAASPGESNVARRDDVLERLLPVQKYVRVHMLFGILAALVTVLVQSIAVTYFIGTGRWVKEVCETYQLSDEFTQRGSTLKRKAFPWAMMSMGVVLMIACFGAAADPGTLRDTTANWVTPHMWAGILGTTLIAFASWKQLEFLNQNQRLIDTIVETVHDIRVERGLPVEATPVSASSGTEIPVAMSSSAAATEESEPE